MNRLLLGGLDRPIVGMIHLKALPAAPQFADSLGEVLDAALADARALIDGGVDAMMLENYGDVPFRRSGVEPHTIAVMTMIAGEVARLSSLPLGINVLRNDPIAALGIACAVGGAMIRVNVHTGAMVTDQGLIEGNAHATLSYRTALATPTAIWADVHVKHAAPLATIPVDVAAADAVERGLADALIVTGSRTGAACDTDELARVRDAVRVPVLVGSGVNEATIAQLLDACDGVIVGSALKRNEQISGPVDIERVRRVVEAGKGK